MIQTLPIGAEVCIMVPDGKPLVGVITSIQLRPGNVMYQVVYWTKETRYETWLDKSEVTPRKRHTMQKIGFAP